MKQQKKKKGRSVQELIGVRTFTKYGLSTNKGELLFYLVSPTNISVLSHTNIEIKIRHLMMVLSALFSSSSPVHTDTDSILKTSCPPNRKDLQTLSSAPYLSRS